MATKLWEQDIDKTVDWGNADGLGTPVSGKYVQKFIKDSLAKKFGYLYYDRAALKYYVFGDEDDYLAYSEDPITNATLLLATFDAPAPADISIISKSNDNVTTLLNATNRKITFNYYIVDKSNNPVAENVSFRAVISRSGEQQTFTDNIPIDRENYDDKEVGTSYSFNLDNYLRNEGTYTITITLTGLNTQASTTMTFFYTVVNLDLSLSTFEYYKPFSTGSSMYSIPFTASGAAGITKTVDIYIDGEPLVQTGLGYNDAISSGDGLTSNGLFTSTLKLYNKDFDGNIVKWPMTAKNIALQGKTIFTPGKHTLQMRISIPGDDAPFYSKTKYFEFVVVDENAAAVNETFLLYVTDAESGTVFDASKPIEITGQQYDGVALNVAVIDNANRVVPVNYSIKGRTTDFDKTVEKTITNQTVDEFRYSFDTADTYDLSIKTAPGFANISTDEIHVVITINPFALAGETIEESQVSNLLVKYTAINRGNGETNKETWINTSESDFARLHPYPAHFENILWNEQSGWDGEALVLRNGATVELPIDLFNDDPENRMWSTLGLTFEIDFETFSVQSDDAVIMDIADPAISNNSYIRITATEASLNSQNNIFLKTNFKDSTRNKIAFAFNPTADVVDGVSQGEGNPNLLMIYVNGVLDRAGKWGNGSANSDSVLWGEHTTRTIKIGNPEGAAGIKIYSIRIYDRALVPEEAFMNYVVDQGSRIPEIITKNHVLDENGDVSLELVKAAIPTLVLYTDYDGANNATNKKDNREYEAQYYDPVDPSLNFYVRHGWLSCQGTSSMQYPTKNLRPYFNKQANDKTFPYSISTSEQASRLANQGIEIGANFNTEFWPVSEYAGNEEAVASYVDTNGIVPYAVNKKEITKDKFFANAYHEIAAGYSKSYKIDLAVKYSAKTEIYYKNGKRDIVSGGKTKSVDRFDIIVADEEQTVAQKINEIVTNGGAVYISAYRPLKRTGWELDSNDYWTYVKQLRFSGVAIYTKKSATNEDGGIGFDFKKAKELEKGKEYYGLGAYWRQYDEVQHYSGWTDRWTLKADYAESSMCHNSGIARVWGNALRNFKLNGQALGMTNAQSCSTDVSFIDIRTSCDGKPIVLFVKNPTGYNEETGRVEYGAAQYAGLFNIMTDKSSTPLFGFEDIKDENNKTIFDASEVQCWEFLQNGSLLGTGNGLAFDNASAKTYQNATMVTDDEGEDLGLNIGKGRPVFDDFEPRWPESGETKHEGDMRWCQDDVFGTESCNFESFWNWCHFTKPAINYEVSGGEGAWLNGYDLSPYVPFANTAEAVEYRERTGKPVYIQWNNSGNIAYAAEGTQYGLKGEEAIYEFNPNVEGLPIYWLNESIDYEKVRKSVSDAKIGDVWGGEVYKVGIYGFDSLNHCRNEEGNLLEDEANKYLVDVYMRRQGNKFFYDDSFGNTNVEYKGAGDAVGPDDYEIASDGVPYSQKTFMQYFSATKWDHLDVYKVAAYYVYIMRFGAVDQVVKNCMMTTEDGQHWYFINYDNDTCLGVRNDAQLIFNWDFDRDTYDYTGNSYAYAGAKSVLWNNLSMDDEFMNIVKSIDSVLYSGGLLSIKTVLEYLNEKQMNVWCERLYNAQEQIKYLSTFKNNFETDKFLLFMQGTRKSHRDWWVNHRWELYDAKWGTGSYADKKIKFYEIVTEASRDREIELLKITAASKYYFTVQKNNRTIDGGFVELSAGESASFSTRENIAIGDPMVFIGPQKLKVLNFRIGVKYLSATLSLNEAYKVTESDGVTTRNTNWVTEAGTMVSKLLIGDGRNNSPLTNISGMNTILSLEEVDLRGCTLLTASPSVTQLSNLHRFRAENSAATIFEPATGVTLYEVSLPSQAADANGTIIVTDEAGNPVQAKNDDGTPMFDVDGKPVYETTTVKTVQALQTLTLVNATFMRQPVSEYQSFQGEDDALQYTETVDEDGKVTLGGIYTNATGLRYTEESGAIFKVTPTIRLSNVTFNNVTGLDTQKFVMDWREVLLNGNISPKTCKLNLTNINWKDITVDELIEFAKGYDEHDNPVTTFTISNFTGTVKVVSKEIDPVTGKNAESITLDEYNRIIKYFTESVFVPGNSLTVTTGDNIFYQPTSDTKTREYEWNGSALDNYCMYQVPTEGKIYEVIRGNVFKAKATRFPADGNTYKYVLSGWGYNETMSTGYKMVVTQSGSTFTCAEAGVKLTTDANGNAVLTAEDKGAYNNSNAVFAITSVKFDGDVPETLAGYEYDTTTNIYVRTVNRVIPAANSVNVYVDGNYTNNVNITDEAKHTVRFDLGAATNAPVESISVNFDNAAYAANVLVDTTNYRVNGRYLEVDFNAAMAANTITAQTSFTILFETTQTTNSVTKVVNITITPTYADTITVTDVNNVALVQDGEYEINRTGTHRFNIKLSSSTEQPFNVPISEAVISATTHMGQQYANYIKVSELTETEDGYYFTVLVNNPGSFQSFVKADLVTLNFYNKFDTTKTNPITFTVDIISSIIYPDKINLCVDYTGTGDNADFTKTGSERNVVDIYLVHNQGTYTAVPGNTSFVELIPGKSDIELRLLAEDTPVQDHSTGKIVMKSPTQTYQLNIEGSFTQSGTIPTGYVNYETTSGLISVGSYEGGHGVDSLKLKINAIPNISGVITLKGKYRIAYDVDNVPNNNNEVDNLVDFTINIHYSVSAANTYKKLAPGRYYLLDADSNYYEVPDVLNDDSSTLTIATLAGVEFIAYGYIDPSNGKPYFIYLRKDDYYKQYDGFFPYPCNTLGKTGTYDYQSKTEEEFDGYRNTSALITILSQDGVANWQVCNIKKMWELYLNTDRVQLYVPTYKELMRVIGNSKSFISRYDEMVNYLKTIAGGEEMYSSLITLSESLQRFTTAETQGETSTLIDDIHNILWLLTSSTQAGASASEVIGIIWNMGEDSDETINSGWHYGGVSSNASVNSAHIRILPFVKAS